jgi:hypothetical protein
LEDGYRRCLRAYPRSWRQAHEEDILACLMEAAGTHQRLPHAADAWNLVVNGFLRRLRQWSRQPTTRVVVQSLPLAGVLGLTILAIAGALVAVGVAVHPAAVVRAPMLQVPAIGAGASFVVAWLLYLHGQRVAALSLCLVADALGAAAAFSVLRGPQVGGPRLVPLVLVGVLAFETTLFLAVRQRAGQPRSAGGSRASLVLGGVALLGAELTHPGGALGFTHASGDGQLIRAGASAAVVSIVLALGFAVRDPRGLIVTLALVGPAASIALVATPRTSLPVTFPAAVVLFLLTLGSLLAATRWSIRRHVPDSVR